MCRLARASFPVYRHSCGGRCAIIVQRKHSGVSQGRLLNFHSTCVGQISQCSWAVYRATGVRRGTMPKTSGPSREIL